MPAPITSLLYVSDSLLDRRGEEQALDDIIATALSRNAALSVTGALLFTRKHFAQVLEGPECAVDELMVSIRKDHRHHKIDVLEIIEIERRRFPNWSMAYSGSSKYIDSFVGPIGDHSRSSDRTMMTEHLMRLMREFASSKP
jgi:hypothetical protein